MAGFEVRWEGFRGFKDTGWLEIRPLTILIGENGTGKTTLLTPFLLLRQTLESRDTHVVLKTKGHLTDVGSFGDITHKDAAKTGVQLSFRFPQLIRPATAPGPRHPLESADISEVHLTFKPGPLNQSPVLSAFEVHTRDRQVPLIRSRQPSGNYSISWKDVSMGEGPLLDAIRRSKPKNFLFQSGESLGLASGGAPLAEISSFVSAMTGPGLEPALRYAMLIQTVENYFTTLLHGLAFVGPLRDPPRRVYEASGALPYNVGPTGRYAPEILYRASSTDLLEKTNRWLRVFQPGWSIATRPLAQGVFVAELTRKGHRRPVNLPDAGFGLSQLLPLIVQSQYAKQYSWIIAEQPEIHLNPKLQGLLADVCADTVSRGVSTIVETHSEHFLMRVRRLVAEGLNADHVALYFTERAKDGLAVRRVPILPDGHIEDDRWPKGFFGDALRESMGLAAAQSKRPN